jgi:hypothetical protein
MRDAVTNLIKTYDVTGRYLDRNAIESLKSYFDTGAARIAAAGIINSNAASIVRRKTPNSFVQVAMPTPPVAMQPACATWITTCVMPPMPWLLPTTMC